MRKVSTSLDIEELSLSIYKGGLGQSRKQGLRMLRHLSAGFVGAKWM